MKKSKTIYTAHYVRQYRSTGHLEIKASSPEEAEKIALASESKVQWSGLKSLTGCKMSGLTCEIP